MFTNIKRLNVESESNRLLACLRNEVLCDFTRERFLKMEYWGRGMGEGEGGGGGDSSTENVKVTGRFDKFV